MTGWANKSVLVLGLGETGLSLLRYLKAQGARVSVADSRTDPPGLAEAKKYLIEQMIYCGEFDDELFIGVDLIAISPGVPLRDPVVARAVACGIPVAGDIELFAQHRNQEPESRDRVIAITGSNGKTTVTSMVEHMCKAAGKDAVAAGNISPAVLDVLVERGDRRPDIWVLELSSFQLETASVLNADAATVLNISEDHLDRYAGMNEYCAAKSRIFRGSAVQVLNRDDACCMTMALPKYQQAGTLVTFGLNAPKRENDFGIAEIEGEVWLMLGTRPLFRHTELQVAGLHNVANALAALALCHAIGLPMEDLIAALRCFKGLPHRVEHVAELGGVIYYDDSKGTNVGATVAALEGLGRKTVLIAGGEGKGQDFAPLNPAVAKHARAVVLIGRDAALIAAALADCGAPIVNAKDMDDAVKRAAQLAQKGDAVLLSPACASFDMFRNYAHRAEVFVAAVRDLPRWIPGLSGEITDEIVGEGEWSQ